MKVKKPYRCVCCRMDVTGKKAKRLSGKRAVCAPCEKLIQVREEDGRVLLYQRTEITQEMLDASAMTPDALLRREDLL